MGQRSESKRRGIGVADRPRRRIVAVPPMQAGREGAGMSDLSPQERIAALRAEADRLQRILDAGSCAEGHKWTLIGGCNAGCDAWCACSVPVYECVICGDSYYGENDEARAIMDNCKVKRA